jgi:hypothetical protein
LSTRPVTPSFTLQQAVLATRDRTFISLVLSWLNRAGPFWEDEREANVDDYFHFEGINVTDQGLGEAARRLLRPTEAGTFSFTDSTARFTRTPLVVKHGLEEDPLGQVHVPNFWQLDELQNVLVQTPTNWQEMLDAAQQSYNGLRFRLGINDSLGAAPFDRGIAERALELLAVLQSIFEETNADSSLTPAGLELLQMHFVGDKAWFSDESEQNKRDFAREMTFVDPADLGSRIFCTWHGKVKKGQFRIHFEWPRPKNQRIIKVVYVGPKITKR